jgi:hypothetical protein
MVRPRMIATMPLPPPSVIVIIFVVVLALAGRIIVSSSTRGGRGAIPGSWKCSVEKRRRTRRGEMREGEVRTVRRDRVRERGESRGADTLGGIRSIICWLGTLGLFDTHPWSPRFSPAPRLVAGLPGEPPPRRSLSRGGEGGEEGGKRRPVGVPAALTCGGTMPPQSSSPPLPGLCFPPTQPTPAPRTSLDVDTPHLLPLRRCCCGSCCCCCGCQRLRQRPPL